jgi:hypothetical protein
VFGKRRGIESVAEQLLASWEWLFSKTLIVIHFNDLALVVL